ncbi:MAG: 50S ribosomal protein L9 [Candidatus Eisenbacteria bacterium]|uniref:Large ribosomal subunit protein bL9 n=1 Tax=Eiseniibacteriota bacterium TaxID=2212470 RepID=A0A538U685_UNCEI|nr:MAG: 50S ribosomal protein L9 [Candidatus Eisenbacteria bacterium]
MQVILLEDLEGLGARGATVNVKPGYARNYLLPRKLAITTQTRAANLYQELARQKEIQLQKKLTEARAEAAKIEGLEVNIAAQANEEDTLFGSVTTTDVADALAKAGHAIDKRRIGMPEEHVKQLGRYDVRIHFLGDVAATVRVWVVRA